MKYKKSLKIGTKIEKEHKRTYNKMKKSRGKMSLKAFAKSTALDHIRESGTRYYPELIKMERKLKIKKKRRYI